jgi:hypothetical protein
MMLTFSMYKVSHLAVFSLFLFTIAHKLHAFRNYYNASLLTFPKPGLSDYTYHASPRLR